MRLPMLLLLACCLFSCKAQKDMAGEKMEGLELVDHDGYSGVEEYATWVIRDTKSLNKFYSQVNKTRKPGLPVPMLDFSKEMAIVVCLGEQKGGQEPMLSKLNETEEELTLAVELTQPEKTDVVQNQAVSYPFYLYRMPLSAKTVGFQKVGW